MAGDRNHHPNVTADNMDMERVRNGIRIRRPKKRIGIYRMKPALSVVYIDLTPLPIHGCSSCAPCSTASAHTQTHSNLLLTPVMMTTDEDDDIDAAPAEPAHASSSATSTSAAGEDASTSTQPCDTNAAELSDVCLIASRSGVALVPCGHSRFCGNCADTVSAMHRQRLPTLSHTDLDGAACFDFFTAPRYADRRDVRVVR